jgi:hypothetical protein
VNFQIEHTKTFPYERGNLIWERDKNAKRINKVNFKLDVKGYWRFWKHPDGLNFKNRYAAGFDIGGGSEEGDIHYGKVLDRLEDDRPEFIASFMSECDSDLLEEEILKAAYYFGLDLFLVIEANNTGKPVIDHIKDEYDNMYVRRTQGKTKDEEREFYGFLTTGSTKPWLVDDGIKWMKEQKEIDYDTVYWVQCSTFVKEPSPRGYIYHAIKKGKSGLDRCFDDGVMSKLLTIQGHKVMSPCREFEIKKKTFLKRIGETFMSK